MRNTLKKQMEKEIAVVCVGVVLMFLMRNYPPWKGKAEKR
jgi:hypothetical protein